MILALPFKGSTSLIHILSLVSFHRQKHFLPSTSIDYVPVLSMIISPSKDHYITSSADAIIAKHPLPAAKSIWQTELKPIKISQTKHSGQQGLSYRSDGKVFATAGWDSQVRVYSGKTTKELAVLGWHKTGCYATAFASVSLSENLSSEDVDEQPDSTAVISKSNPHIGTVQRRRDEKAQSTHWFAAGAKDGKISLWDIY